MNTGRHRQLFSNTIVQAGEREALEEAGIAVKIEGVLRFMLDGCCPRIVFLARPIDENAECKSIPNFESVGSLWTSHEMLKELNNPADFRSDDPILYFPAVARGELQAVSLETDAFCAFEQTISELTQKRNLTQRDVAPFFRVWEQLKSTYPASAFQ